jgi:hypothetical protein
MPTLPTRSAAYTRTGILKRFLDQLSAADPGRVDNAYAEGRLGLKGGDVRAFLQTLRVLGVIDPYGQTTERARRLRAQSGRGPLIRDALREAYPELAVQWNAEGGMARPDVEDFFKVQYGLSGSSAAPAAKLFCDLMREYDNPASGAPPSAAAPSGERPSGKRQETRRIWEERAAAVPAAHASPPAAPAAPIDPRLAAFEAIKSTVRIDINAEWDEEKIRLVFDRMERLFDRLLGPAGGEQVER